MRALKLGRMLLREWVSNEGLIRRPEPTQLMDNAVQVAAFHSAGAAALVPVYHFNALAISRLARPGGTVVDLGSGSAQFLVYLSLHRPDLRIIGIELAPAMVAQGQSYIAGQGLAGRIDLRCADMTTFSGSMDSPVDVISSVFSLHHLPTPGDLTACLEQIRIVRSQKGSGLWIFDHVRPRNRLTAEDFPGIFTPQAAPAFQQDSSNSLRAAFSYAELVRHLKSTELGAVRHLLSRWMRLYQVHWMAPVRPVGATAPLWRESSLSAMARREWTGLQKLFPDCADTP